uniref:CSON006626 protein n=1 Tax=Culicoides sonorensis TaxID=179676 RepID=A0A336KGJ2_CULSO
MSSLIRAVSWPLISPNHTCIEQEKNGFHQNGCPKGPVPTSPTFQQLMAARRLLCRRYYPEGGWGWCIVIVATFVNIITHGLQLSYGVHMQRTATRFNKDVNDSGKSHMKRNALQQ